MPQGTSAVKLRDDSWYTLGRSGVSNVKSPNIVEGADFEVGPTGSVRRLRDLGDATRTFTFTYTDPVPTATPVFNGDLPSIDQINDAVTQLRAYLQLPSPSLAQTSSALKLVIRGLFYLLKSNVSNGIRP
jgi:hypothetical protein